MENIRKNKVDSCNEIANYLWKKERERAIFFIDKVNQIGNDELVKDFWNLLVEYKKCDNILGVSVARSEIANGVQMDGFNVWALAMILSEIGTATMYAATNSGAVALLGSLSTVGTITAAIINDLHHMPKAERTQKLLDAMRIREPELVDIELCFNKVDMEQVKTAGDISKKAYQEAHEVWNEYLKKTGVDLTKKDAEWTLVSEKLRESLNKTYQKEYELVK